MFGLGMGEIVIIAIVALLFLGPERLPAAAKSIGKTIRDLRRQTRELTSTLEKESDLGDAVREIRSALHDPIHRIMEEPAKSATAESSGPGPVEDDGVHAESGVYGDEDDGVHVESGVDDVSYPPPEASATPAKLAEAASESGMPLIRAPESVIARGAGEEPAESNDDDTPPKSEHG